MHQLGTLDMLSMEVFCTLDTPKASSDCAYSASLFHVAQKAHFMWACGLCCRSMGMEVCCTLGMLNKEQALQLRAAGLTAYNHNLDTSREYYPNVITTRTYDDRLETLDHVREAGIAVCSGTLAALPEAFQGEAAVQYSNNQFVLANDTLPLGRWTSGRPGLLSAQVGLTPWDTLGIPKYIAEQSEGTFGMRTVLFAQVRWRRCPLGV